MDAHQKTMRRNGRILTALLAAVLLTLTACSSTGGKPRSTGEGMAAGQADTPRFTIAMVTHGPPGEPPARASRTQFQERFAYPAMCTIGD